MNRYIAKNILLTVFLFHICFSSFESTKSQISIYSPLLEIKKQNEQKSLPDELQKACDVPKSIQESSFFVKVLSDNFWSAQGKSVQDENEIWVTHDAGKTWKLFHKTNDYLRNYEILSSQLVWSWALDYAEKTSDGGTTWERVPTPLDEEKGVIHSIDFLPDGKRGWLAGGFYRLPTKEEKNGTFPINQSNSDRTKVFEGVVYFTSDSGKSWKRQLTGYCFRIYGVFIFDEKRLLAFTDTTAYLSENSGKNWQLIKLKKNCVSADLLDENQYIETRGFDAYDSKNWWLGFAGGTILKSTDAGKTWCEILHCGDVDFDTSFGQSSFDAFEFVNPKLGYGIGGDTYMYKTEDGGLSWKRIFGNMRFRQVSFLKPDKLFLVDGESIYRLSF